MKKYVVVSVITFVAYLLSAAPLVSVQKAGVEKITVTLNVGGSQSYIKCLSKNLSLSGLFQVGPGGSIKVTGTAGAQITAEGRGKRVTSADTFADDRSARMAARKFADQMVAAYSEGGKGYAQTRIAFVNRKGSDNAELYMCYPDGMDIRQLTSDGHAAVGPRWAPNNRDIYYTGFLQKTPLVYRLDSASGKRTLLAQFKGLATGAAVSPDGSSAAIILSYQGNPELYILNLSSGRARRMTITNAAAESSPCWSPDGSKIAYVSDLTRQPQIYVCDVASGKSTRFTNQGIQNTNPDWSADGKLCWASKRGGTSYICVTDASAGESAARVVTEAGQWEHPSWAADSRHLVASRDSAIFIVDSEKDGDKPVQVFYNKGKWMNPAFSR